MEFCGTEKRFQILCKIKVFHFKYPGQSIGKPKERTWQKGCTGKCKTSIVFSRWWNQQKHFIEESITTRDCAIHFPQFSFDNKYISNNKISHNKVLRGKHLMKNSLCRNIRKLNRIESKPKINLLEIVSWIFEFVVASPLFATIP